MQEVDRADVEDEVFVSPPVDVEGAQEETPGEPDPEEIPPKGNKAAEGGTSTPTTPINPNPFDAFDPGNLRRSARRVSK